MGDEAAIVTEIGNVIRALNAALANAQTANLEVRIDYITMEELGKRGGRRIYSADISKLAFSHRV